MKTIKISSIKGLLTLLSMLLFSLTGFSNPHITMSLKNISATSNTIEFDLFIVNDGTTALKLSGCSFGINFDHSILNGGNIHYSYLEGTQCEALNGLTAFSLATATVDGVNQLRMTSGASRMEDSPELVPYTSLKVGRFNVTNSVSWAKNSTPSFTFQQVSKPGLTSTQAIGYFRDDTYLSALTPISKTVAVTVEHSPILNPSEESANSTTLGHGGVHSNGSDLLSDDWNIRIYPNPALDILKLDLSGSGKSEIGISIMDLQGRLVKHVSTSIVDGLNTIKIDINSLAKGVYSVKVSDQEKRINYCSTFSKK